MDEMSTLANWLGGFSVYEQAKIYIYACIYTFGHMDNIYKGGQISCYPIIAPGGRHCMESIVD